MARNPAHRVIAQSDLFDAFFIAAPAGLALLDSRLRYVHVNDTLAQMNRHSLDEHVGKTVREVVPRLAPVIEPILREVLTTGKPALNRPLTIPPGPSFEAAQYRVASYFPVQNAQGRTTGIGIIVADVTEYHHRVRQEEAVAQLGLLALGDVTVDALMEQCAVLVSQALDVEYCKILEILPGGATLRLRAGVGWKEGLVGHATEPAGLGSDAGYTLRTTSPTIVDDLRTETRFRSSPLLTAHDIVSDVDVIIHGREALFGVLGAHTARRRTFTGDDVNFLQAVANVIAAALENRRAADGLRALARQLLEAHETVQRSIARELHDEIGQALTALKLVLDMARRQPAADELGQLRDAQALVDDLIRRTRQLSLNLRPAALDDLGLLPAARHHLERYTSTTGIQVVFEHSGVEGHRFSAAVETAAYRIIQEALTNVARHAGVDTATVRLWTAGGTLGAEIEDKGAGFDAAVALGSQRSSGLIGMRERAVLLGGRLTVDSAPGTGARIIVELPCGENG